MTDIPTLAGLTTYPRSVATIGNARAFLVRSDDSGKKLLAILAAADDPAFNAFAGEGSDLGDQRLLLGPANTHNAAALRGALAWLRPQPLGLRTSAGTGDRLGLATPGHVRAMRKAKGVMPIYAQQSIRENAERWKELGTSLDLVQDHHALQVTEGQLGIFEAREILRALEIEERGRPPLPFGEHSRQRRLSDLTGAEQGNDRAPCQEPREGRLLTLPLDHVPESTMKSGCGQSNFQGRRSQLRLEDT